MVVIYVKGKTTRHIPNYRGKPLCDNRSMGKLSIWYKEDSEPTCSRCMLIKQMRDKL